MQSFVGQYSIHSQQSCWNICRSIGCMNLHRSPQRPWINTLPKYTFVAVSNSYYPGYRNNSLRFRAQRSVAASKLGSLLLCHTWRSAAKYPLYSPRSLHRTIYFVLINYPVRISVALLFQWLYSAPPDQFPDSTLKQAKGVLTYSLNNGAF